MFSDHRTKRSQCKTMILLNAGVWPNERIGWIIAMKHALVWASFFFGFLPNDYFTCGVFLSFSYGHLTNIEKIRQMLWQS